MAKGWIKLHRQLQECPIWYGERFSKGQAWVDLLLLANHRDKKILFNGEMVTIKRGQYLTSMVKLAEKWGWNRKTVSSYLKVLEDEHMITKVTDNSKTLITIENYEIYQGIDDEDGQPIGQLITQQTDNLLDNSLGTETDNRTDTETDTNKNVKNIKNNNICPKSLDKSKQEEQLRADFDTLYSSYPKKVGKTKAFPRYKAWVTSGRKVNGKNVKLTNRQIWDAIALYKKTMEDKETDLQFYKNFDTFMGDSILDYVMESE